IKNESALAQPHRPYDGGSMFTTLKPVFAIGVSVCVIVSAANAPIGTARAGGDFRLAGATVRGNGTVFQGDTVESNNLVANVVIDGATELTISPHSRTQVFTEKAIIESGINEIRVPRAYAVEAGPYRLSMRSGRILIRYTPETGKMRVLAREGD